MNTVQLYNFIDKIVKQIPFVKNYSNKDVYEVWMNEEIKYGAVSFLVENAYTTENSTKFNVILYYGDRLTSDKSNVSQVQSDAIAVIQAIVGTIQQSDGPIEVSYPVQEVLFEQKFADELAGAYARFSIITRGMGECDFDVDYPIVPGIVDINEYYNKKEVDTLLNTKADKANTYTKKQVDDAIAKAKPDVDLSGYYKKTETYNQAEINNKLYAKADKVDTYTKKEVKQIASTKADKDNTYTKAQINDKFANIDLSEYYKKTETYSQEQVDEIIDQATIGGEVDLRNYYKKSQTNELLDLKADKENTYTKEEVDSAINSHVPDLSEYYKKTETYNQTEIDDKIKNVKVDLSDYYKKGETYDQKTIDDKVGEKVDNTTYNSFVEQNAINLSNKADKADTYTIQQVDEKLAEKVNNTSLSGYYKKEETYSQAEANNLLDAKADKETTYTKVDVNGLLDKKANIGDSYLKSETYDQKQVNDLLDKKIDALDVYDIPTMDSKLAEKVDNTTFDAFKLTNTEEINKKANIGDSYTTTESDGKYRTITDSYDKTKTNELLDLKANKEDVYTQIQVDNELVKKLDKSVYDNFVVDNKNKLDNKADKATVYTITQVDDMLKYKADTDAVYTQSQINIFLDKKADKETTYTKTDVNDLLKDNANKLDATFLYKAMKEQTAVSDENYQKLIDAIKNNYILFISDRSNAETIVNLIVVYVNKRNSDMIFSVFNGTTSFMLILNTGTRLVSLDTERIGAEFSIFNNTSGLNVFQLDTTSTNQEIKNCFTDAREEEIIPETGDIFNVIENSSVVYSGIVISKIEDASGINLHILVNDVEVKNVTDYYFRFSYDPSRGMDSLKLLEKVSNILNFTLINDTKMTALFAQVDRMQNKLDSMVVDEQMSETSTNPVQNKVVNAYINNTLGDINKVLLSILNDK